MLRLIAYSLVIALIASVVLCICVVRRYKKGLFSPIYPLEKFTTLELTHSDDIFLNRHVTRVRIARSDNDDD